MWEYPIIERSQEFKSKSSEVPRIITGFIARTPKNLNTIMHLLEGKEPNIKKRYQIPPKIN